MVSYLEALFDDRNKDRSRSHRIIGMLVTQNYCNVGNTSH